METAPRLDDVLKLSATASVSQLPVDVVEVLEAAAPGDLRLALTTLIGLLTPPPAKVVSEAASRHTVPQHCVRSIVAHALLPMTVVMSVLVLLMAWIR